MDNGIQPVCDICTKNMNEFGGLIFSPPQGHNVKKYHICVNCYEIHVNPLFRVRIDHLIK